MACNPLQLEKRGICQYGKPISDTFQPVPPEYYVASILGDVSSAADGILVEPAYYVLNLCRMLFYLREGTVSSKKEAAEWAIPLVSPEFADVVDAALHDYSGSEGAMDANALQLSRFANFMSREIQACLEHSPPKAPESDPCSL
jgi:hypothetical protein